MNIKREINKIAKLITSFKYLDPEGFVTVLSGKKWPKYTAQELSNDKYSLYIYKGAATVKKELEKLVVSDERELRRLMEEVDPRNFIDLDGLLNMYKEGLDSSKAVAKYLYRSIEARIYSISSYPKIEFTGFKKNHLYDLVINKEFENLDKVKFFNLMTSKMKLHPDVFTEFFGEFDMEESDRIKKVKHNKWDIYIDSGVKVEEKELFDILDASERALSKRGLSYLAYGKIIAVNTIKGSILADYMDSKDSIRIRTKKIKGSKGEVHSLLHELGHRDMNKFLSKEDINNIQRAYIQAKNNIPSTFAMGVDSGDIIFNTAKGDAYEVKELRRTKAIGKLIETKNKRKQKNLGGLYEIPSEVLFNNFLINGQKPKGQIGFFPSNYATKNYEEMYSELFAGWLLGGINDEAKAFMESLH